MGMTIQFEMGKGSKDVRMVGAEVISKKEDSKEKVEEKEVPTLEPKDALKNETLEETSSEEESKEEKSGYESKVGLKPLSEFLPTDDKDLSQCKLDLEAYGKTFGVDLARNKSLENMYVDLTGHVAK